jgi:uncharacterized membrane protein
MKLYYTSFFLTVIGNLIYHVAQKSIPQQANPFFACMIIYLIASAGCFLGSFLYSGATMAQTIKHANWAIVAAGLAVFSIEIGFLFAYRSGWKLGSAAVACSVAVTIVLFPLGVALFREALSIDRVLGTVLCALGLLLVARQ